MSNNIRDLNFRLHELEEGPIRDHFTEVQEVHDEGKIGDLYQLGFGVFTDEFDVEASTTVKKEAPGEIMMLSGMVQLDPVTYGWVPFSGNSGNSSTAYPLMNFTLTYDESNKVYAVINSHTTTRKVKIFCIYKRP